MRAVVRADSWHYRYWKWLQDPLRFMDRWDAPSPEQLKNRAKEPNGLCGYFWLIVLSPVFLAGMLATVVLVGTLAAGIGAVVGSGWLIREGWRGLRRRERVGLVATYAAARKKAICPLIEVDRS